jgi:hypothetical protein
MGVGGQGGEPGVGGEGGGGGGDLTLAQACTEICADTTALTCNADCQTNCEGIGALTYAADEYLAMVQCEAENLGPSNYECFAQGGGAPPMMGPSWNGACETELCAWTCADAMYVEASTYDHCACQ